MRVSSTRPTAAELAAAVHATLDDVIAAGLDVLFCGINPGLWSAATGHHFARQGNRFWPALHLSGFTPRQLRPDEQWELLDYGLGITNLVARATARAEELTGEELRAGGKHLLSLVEETKPRALAVVGLGAYRTAFGDKTVTVGPRPDRLGDTLVWVLPNPSGLNAHWQLPDLAAEFSRLRTATRSRRRRPR